MGSGNNEVDGEINGSVVGNKVDCAIVVHSMEVPEEVLYRARVGHVHMDIVLYRVQRVVSGNSEINGDFNGTVVGNKVDGDINGSA